jgi:DNA-binding NarL/FixJ family response regulator
MQILIADDHEIVRRGLKQALAERPEWKVCGESGTGRDAVAKALRLKPDVVVMDIAMPEMNGLDATRKIRQALPETQFVILTLHLSDQLVYDILEAGARSYILKSDAERDLITAVEAVSRKRTYFTSKVSEMMVNRFHSDGNPPREEPGPLRMRLTARQREIVQLLAEGKTNKEIANTLNISVKTAETHRANIMRRLALHSVSDLVRYAVKNQIIEA